MPGGLFLVKYYGSAERLAAVVTGWVLLALTLLYYCGIIILQPYIIVNLAHHKRPISIGYSASSHDLDTVDKPLLTQGKFI